jgi:hypothetical protein
MAFCVFYALPMKKHDPLARFRPGYVAPEEPDEPDSLEQDENGDALPLANASAYVAYRLHARPARLALYCLDDIAYSLSYAQFIQAAFNPIGGERISLLFHHAYAVVTGRNLQAIGPMLNRQKIGFLQAFDLKRWQAPAADEPRIDSIVFTPVSKIPGLD